MTEPIIRPETIADCAAVGDLHARAFGRGWSEPGIVALLRQRQDFDPELSIVAELEGGIVGHVLLLPGVMRLLGDAVPVVKLGPIGVEPAWQGRGIGGVLVRHGHEVALHKGYGISVLVGHSTYYPRFGYRTHAYGTVRLSVNVDEMPVPDLERRAPVEGDIPELRELWRSDEADVDFAFDPGPGPLDWISPNPDIQAQVYIDDGEIVGYIRYRRSDPSSPLIFLASNGEAARRVAGVVGRELGARQLNLPVHPASRSAEGLGRAAVQRFAAAMACALGPSRLGEYFDLVDCGERPAGRVIWPVQFEL